MNSRKKAFQQGLTPLKRQKKRSLAPSRGKICAIRPSLYNAGGMPETNQIIQGDSIEVLNHGPEGWVDLVFAAVFTIGAALAGMTGVLGGPVLGLSIGLEFDVLLLAVVVVVVGGIGSLSGAFIASMAVGLIDAYGKARFPELSYFTLFVPVILILLLRPSGLLGRASVD